MDRSVIQLGEWAPDRPVLENSGATEALNVMAGVNSYRPFRDQVGVGPAAGFEPSVTRGAAIFQWAGLDSQAFYGFTSVIIHSTGVGGELADVSNSAGHNGFPQRVEGAWRFVRFGALVIAVNGLDPPQYYSPGSSTLFADLAGSPPTGARYVVVVRDNVVFGCTTADPSGVAWSDTNNAQSYTTGAADSQSFGDGGQVVGMAGGETLRVFQESAIRLGVPTQYPVTFTFDKVSDTGLLMENSLATHGNKDFFVSSEGIMMLVNGTEVVPIGAERVNRYFFSHLYNSERFFNVVGAIDPVNKLYVLGYDATGADLSGGGVNVLNAALLYNWETNRWSRAEFGTDWIFTGRDEDENHTILCASKCRDDEPVVFLFNGDNLAARVTTGEIQLTPGRRSFVSGLRVLCDGGTPTATLYARNLPTENATATATVTQNSNGVCPFRSEARFHRAQIDIAAGATWSHIQGVEPEFRPAGYR